MSTDRPAPRTPRPPPKPPEPPEPRYRIKLPSGREFEGGTYRIPRPAPPPARLSIASGLARQSRSTIPAPREAHYV